MGQIARIVQRMDLRSVALVGHGACAKLPTVKPRKAFPRLRSSHNKRINCLLGRWVNTWLIALGNCSRNPSGTLFVSSKGSSTDCAELNVKPCFRSFFCYSWKHIVTLSRQALPGITIAPRSSKESPSLA